MSIKSATRHNIKTGGRVFEHFNAGVTLKGVLSDNTVTFLPEANIRLGDLLRDQIGGNTYIVSDVSRTTDSTIAMLVKYHLLCTVSRHVSGDRNAFGRSAASLVVVADDVPIIIDYPDRGAVPITADVRHGDLITVEKIGETYRVQAVSRYCLPGCLNLLLSRQG